MKTFRITVQTGRSRDVQAVSFETNLIGSLIINDASGGILAVFAPHSWVSVETVTPDPYTKATHDAATGGTL